MIPDLLAGQIQLSFENITTAYPQVKGGKLKALAVSSPQRSPLAPDVPTIAELGYPGFDVQFAYAFMAPAGTSDEIVQLLNREVNKAMKEADVIEKNRIADYAPTNLDAKQSAAWLRDNREKWTKVIQQQHISAE
jgi:tripartite-type tricarboxylate transporter receptor subunit TctC